VELGGRAWERAGLVWYRTLTSGTLSRTANFAAFAAATIHAAEAEFGATSAEVTAVRSGWKTVGVTPAG
jgi:Zn-dependent metalloprotease